MTPEHLNQHLRKTLSRGRVAASVPAGCPDLPLYLFDPSVLEGPLSHDEAQAVVAEPAYWSFCWASGQDRKSTRLNSSHVRISYAVFCLKKKMQQLHIPRQIYYRHWPSSRVSWSCGRGLTPGMAPSGA